MAVINISEFEDTLVLHFETIGSRINAYTLASTLIAIADAAKAANECINPSQEIEIVVEALGPGSFRALVKALVKSRGGALALVKDVLWSGIVLGVLGNYVYERTLSADNSVKVEVNADEVIIQQGNDRIIVPRNIYDATREAEKNPEFQKSVVRILDSISKDDSVRGFGIVSSLDAPPPAVLIPRESLLAASLRPIDMPNERVVPEVVDLQILKAILERSKRKWEFMWRGVKISAPVVDEKFYIDFFAHDITIAPGDILNVTLHIYQQKDLVSGIYRNVKYEVVRVHSHTPRVRQLKINTEEGP